MSLIQAFTAAVVPLALFLANQSPDAKPLVQIVELLEQQGYGPFTEISFDDGYWEVEVYKQDAPRELAIDSRNGEILSEHRDDAEPRPPRNAQPLSKILRSLERAGYGRIHEVSFERRYWEVESFRADGKHETHVDPATAEIINDRLDD